MKKDWINNDTVALLALALICLCAVFLQMETLCSAAVGAIGGYIGSHMMHRPKGGDA